MHGNMDSHPDIGTITKGLEAVVEAHNRNTLIGGYLIMTGSVMVGVGSLILKTQKRGLIK